MTDFELLNEAIKDRGLSMVKLAERSGIRRETLYNRLAGKGEFTQSEIEGLTSALQLTKKKRDDIFFCAVVE